MSELATPAVLAALEKVASKVWKENQTRRDLLADITAGMKRDDRKVVESWLDKPLTRRQLLSNDPAHHRSAAATLKNAFAERDADATTVVETVVTAARQALVERLPPSKLIDQLRTELGEDHEQLLAGQSQLISDQSRLHVLLDRFLSEQKERMTRRDVGHVTAEVFPAAAKLLEGASDKEHARLLHGLIRDRPTKPAIERWSDAGSPLATRDYRVWEAAARYASGRGLNDAAARLWARAATFSPEPDRHRTRQVLSLYLADDGAAARQQLTVIDQPTLLSRLIELTIDDKPAAVADLYDSKIAGELDPSDADDRTAGQLAVQALVQVGRFDDARALAERLAEHSEHARSQLAGVLLASVVEGHSRARTTDLNLAIQLATEAREQLHRWGLPAKQAAYNISTAAGLIGDTERVTEVIDTARREGWDEEIDVEMIAQAAIARELHGDDGFADEEMPEFYHRYLQAVRPYLTSDDSPVGDDRYVEQLRAALEIAETDVQLLRVLRALARADAVPEERLAELEEREPQAAAIVRAVRHHARGNSEAATAVLRPHARTDPEVAGLLITLLEEAELLDEAVEVAIRTWEEFQDVPTLTFGLHIAAGDVNGQIRQRALDIGTRALSQPDLTDDQTTRLLQRLVSVAAMLNDWNSTRDLAARLYDLTGDPDVGWQLATAHVNLGQPRRGWQVVATDDGLIDIRNKYQLQSASSFALSYSQDPCHVQQLLDAADTWREDEETFAVALMASYQVALRTEDPDASRRAHEELEWFTHRYPDSPIVRRVPFDPGDPVAFLEQFLPAPSRAIQAIARDVRLGVQPIAFVALLANRPLSWILAAGREVLHAASQRLIDRVRDRRTAAEALGHQPVVVDLTTLYVLGCLSLQLDDGPAIVDRLLGMFRRVDLPYQVALDVARGLAEAVSPEGGTMIPPTEPGDAYRWVETDPDQFSRSQHLLQEMERIGDHMDPIEGPSNSVLLDGVPDEGLPVGLVAGEVGAERNCIVWVDDHVLREHLRQHGVASFNTRSLLDALLDRGELTREDHARIVETLRLNHVTDLPITRDELKDLAAQFGWRVGPATLAVGQPGWWQARANTATPMIDELFEAVVSNCPEALSGWFHTACLGLGSFGDRVKDPPRLLLYVLERVPQTRDHVHELIDALAAVLDPFGTELTGDLLAVATVKMREHRLLTDEPTAAATRLLGDHPIVDETLAALERLLDA